MQFALYLIFSRQSTTYGARFTQFRATSFGILDFGYGHQNHTDCGGYVVRFVVGENEHGVAAKTEN
jgi:hypothetical protein